MPRRALRDAGGIVFHVLNRSARRSRLFYKPEDYVAFEVILAVALRKFRVRLLAYCVMPNHWHLVLWPEGSDLPRFMHWLTLIHARQWHEANGTHGSGHVYQDRYRAIPVQDDRHLLTLIRYVERNPLRAHLVDRAEQWQWSSAWDGGHSCNRMKLTPWPIPRPVNWIEMLNETQTGAELEAVQKVIRGNRPLGEEAWRATVAVRVGLSLRRRGRPSGR